MFTFQVQVGSSFYIALSSAGSDWGSYRNDYYEIQIAYVPLSLMSSVYCVVL